jgi:hypothetical protein
LWCNIDESVKSFMDWLMDEIYFKVK